MRWCTSFICLLCQHIYHPDRPTHTTNAILQCSERVDSGVHAILLLSDFQTNTNWRRCDQVRRGCAHIAKASATVHADKCSLFPFHWTRSETFEWIKLNRSNCSCIIVFKRASDNTRARAHTPSTEHRHWRIELRFGRWWFHIIRSVVCIMDSMRMKQITINMRTHLKWTKKKLKEK